MGGIRDLGPENEPVTKSVSCFLFHKSAACSSGLVYNHRPVYCRLENLSTGGKGVDSGKYES